MKVACPEFVATSLVYPDWQAESPHLLPAGPGAAWHSQSPGPADGQVLRVEMEKDKRDSFKYD